MKRYFIGLLIITIVMMLLAFAVKWTGMAFFAPVKVWLLPTAVLYFAIAYGAQSWMIVKSMNKQPKAFIQFFLATTVAVLFIHLVVLIGGMLSNPAGGKRFAVAFLFLYVVYTFHMIATFVSYVKRNQTKEDTDL